MTKKTSPTSREWAPKWTVITTPPSLAERWAIRALSSRRQGGVALLLIWLVYLTMNGVRAWTEGEMGWVYADAALFILTAVFAWDCYAFGQLLERYDAELRDVQLRTER